MTQPALEHHPTKPPLYEALGDRLPSTQALSEAAEAYRRALDLDAGRPPQEIRRFRPRKIEALRTMLDKCSPQ